MAIFRKDLVSENNHPLNLVEAEGIDETSVTRPPIFEVYMRMAEELAKRRSHPNYTLRTRRPELFGELAREQTSS